MLKIVKKFVGLAISSNGRGQAVDIHQGICKKKLRRYAHWVFVEDVTSCTLLTL